MNIKESLLDKLQGLGEEITPDDVNLSSFQQQKTLNKDIWDENNKLNPMVREKLLKIADDFKESLDIPWVEYQDVLFTGSLANYNWSNYSDIDLHILLDRSDIDDNKELVNEYLSAKKDIWNDTHDLTIKGYDVECYAQDIKEKHTSTGVYSILKDTWVIQPSPEQQSFDKELVKRKASQIMNKVDKLQSLFDKGQYNKVLDYFEILWEGIKKLRKTGLDRDGEYSYENLVFKVLRRTGYLEKLVKLKIGAYDKVNSLK